MDITIIQYAELAKWSDQITEAATKLLNRGQDEDRLRVCRLIDYWKDHFDELSFQSQKEVDNAKLQ